MWENIWSFKTANFRIDYDVQEESDLDLSWDEDGSTREGLESGKYVAFIARVVVWYQSLEAGSDYLGQCIYESPEAFIDHRGIKRHKHGGSYFSDMVHCAIAEARKTLCNVPKLRCNHDSPSTLP